MKVNDLRFSWIYNPGIVHDKKGKEYNVIQTICKVSKSEEPLRVFAFGEATQSISDTHNKDKARRVSLTNALRSFTLGVPRNEARKFRTDVWEAYRTMPKSEPRWKTKIKKRSLLSN